MQTTTAHRLEPRGSNLRLPASNRNCNVHNITANRVFKRQVGWPESVKNDLTGHFHRFMASLTEMSNQASISGERVKIHWQEAGVLVGRASEELTK